MSDEQGLSEKGQLIYSNNDDEKHIAGNNTESHVPDTPTKTPDDHDVTTELLDDKLSISLEDQLGPPPRDRLNLVYLVMVFHGIGILMPWNMFISSESYFKNYKLIGKAVSVDCADASRQDLRQYIEGCCDEVSNTSATCFLDTEYRRNFIAYMGIVAQTTNLLLNGLNFFLRFGGQQNQTRRIVFAILTVISCFAVTIVLAMVDSSDWPGVFFTVTMIIIVVANMGNGIYHNCAFGMSAILPMRYTNAVVLGTNLSGTATAIIFIISVAASPNLRTAAIYYFVVAIAVLLIALDTLFALPYLSFYRYHHKKNAIESQRKAHLDDTGIPLRTFLLITKKIWPSFFSIFLVFFVTLTCFPAMQANIEPMPDFWFKMPFYRLVTCFLFFNLFALLGNAATEFVHFPGPKYVWIPVVIRLVFIPFFFFCNYKPDIRAMNPTALPVLIQNDYVYVAGGVLMAFTSGYYSSLVMMYAPREVDGKVAGIAAMMCAFFLTLGIMCGVNFSLVVAKILESIALSNTGLPNGFNSTLSS